MKNLLNVNCVKWNATTLHITHNCITRLLLLLHIITLHAFVVNAEWNPTHPDPIIEYHYSYDHVGNITKVEDVVKNSTSTFTYDEVDRLTQAIGSYGAGGAQVTQSYSYNAVGDIQGVAEPIKDGNGNALNYDNKTIEYDYENRPIRITDNDNGTITECKYDYAGQRVLKKVSQLNGALLGRTFYVGNIYEVHYSSGGVETQTIHIYAGSMRVASRVTDSVGSRTFYYLGDHLGSTRMMTDALGQVVQDITYEPWGSTVTATSTSYDSPYKFTGQALDDSTGLYYYGARYYDPTLRRFITPDTIVQSPYDPQSLNRYAYCRNNPLIYKDPSGHFIVEAMILGAMYNTFMNFENIHNLRDFGQYAAIGAAEGALTYLTGGGGAAGLNRVIAQGFTSVYLGSLEKATGVFSRQGKGGFYIYMVASALMQGAMQDAIYRGQTPVDLQKLSQDELRAAGTTDSSREKYLTKILGFEESKGIPGGTQLHGIPAENWRKVMVNGEWKGIVGSSRAFKPYGSWSQLTHTASAAAKGTGAASGFHWTRYLIDKGVCHQSVGMQFWASGLNVAPSQLYHTWDAYLTTGVYGPIGGTGAFPVFLGNTYYTYDINKKQ